jgi:hypothetical protein
MTPDEIQGLTFLIGGIDAKLTETQKDICEIKNSVKDLTAADDEREKRLTTLEVEHRNRVSVEACPVTTIGGFKLNKKQVGVSALISSPLAVLLYLLLKAIMAQKFGITI